MTVTINLTPVLTALIICVFLYAMCKMARRDETKKKRLELKELKIPEFKSGRNNMQVVTREEHKEMHNRTNAQEQDLGEWLEEQVKKGEGK